MTDDVFGVIQEPDGPVDDTPLAEEYDPDVADVEPGDDSDCDADDEEMI